MFDDCLKQVGGAYPDLDLSQIVIEHTVPLTLEKDDSINDESDDSIHKIEQEVKDGGVIIAHPIPEGLIASAVSSAEDLSAEGGPNIMNPTIFDAPLS